MESFEWIKMLEKQWARVCAVSACERNML